LLPLPAPYKVSRLQVCFRFQLRIKLVASEFASASSFFLQSAVCFRFHKNLTASPLPLPHPWFRITVHQQK